MGGGVWRRRLEEIKWAGREDVRDCQDQSVSNAESNPRKMPSVYVFFPLRKRTVSRVLHDHNQASLCRVGCTFHQYECKGCLAQHIFHLFKVQARS